MYLIHTRLGGTGGAAPPDDVTHLVLAAANADDGVEHVRAHPDATPHPVLALWIVAPSLREAEARALEVCRRTLAGSPKLRGWEVVSSGAAFVTPYYERLLSSSGPD
ncbi:hypothetical protein ACF061_16835 [Streptomyces sp. NPDC015220]|uniref:hypothetical protein n=1 Tax=Streptomyces sp. NPDC015220 TaxID=3364947 RepID=UPI0036FEB291